MKTISTVVCTLLISVTISAQWGGKKIKGNGNTTTISRSVGDYDAIAVAGWFDVELVSGKEGKISLKGEENLLEYVKTEVKDGKLVIKTKKGVSLRPSWNSGILISVPIEEVLSVSLSGSGDVYTKTTIKTDYLSTAVAGSGDINLNVEVEELKASLSGSGDIRISGEAYTFKTAVSGSGDIHAYDLKANYVNAAVSGSADIRVTAVEKITARVSGSGDITYKGNPEKVDSKVSGSGDVSSY